MRFINMVLLLGLFAFAPCVPAAQPIDDLIDQPIGTRSDGSALSFGDVQQAIVRACQTRGWSPNVETPGQIVASILVRGRHYAEIEIPFSTQAYSIRYRSSRNLDYDAEKRKIHRNYNKWVVLLSRDINQELTDRARPAVVIE